MPIRIRNTSTLALSLSLAFLATSARAQDTTQISAKAREASSAPSSLKTHNLGFGAGFLTGYGLTYRHWYPSKHGYQLTFIPVARLDDQETYFNTSLGAIGLRSLHQTRHSNFFGYYGGHYNFTYEERQDMRYPAGTPEPYEFNQVLHNLYAGAGMGFEVHFWNVNASLMFGYAANARTEKEENPYLDTFPSAGSPKSGEWRNSFQFQPSIEGALFYSF